MARMERTDDFTMGIDPVDWNAAGVVLRRAIPRNCRLIKMFSIKGGAFTGAALATVASSKGNLTDTLTIVTAGAANDIASVDFRPETNNAFAEGTFVTVTSDGTPTATSNAGLQLVFRPL